MIEEEWRDVKGYEGLYQVSNLGRVKSLNYKRTGKSKILRPRNNGLGYLQILLYKGGECKWYGVHRLVLSTFSPVENMENLDCNHCDENKENNNLNNLEWCTRSYNNNYGTRNKRAAEKNTNGKCSIPIVQLTLEGKFVKAWKSSMEAERGGFNQGAIIQCCKNKYLREGNNIYKGYKWQYLNYYISQIDPRIKKVILFNKEYEF